MINGTDWLHVFTPEAEAMVEKTRARIGKRINFPKILTLLAEARDKGESLTACQSLTIRQHQYGVVEQVVRYYRRYRLMSTQTPQPAEVRIPTIYRTAIVSIGQCNEGGDRRCCVKVRYKDGTVRGVDVPLMWLEQFI